MKKICVIFILLIILTIFSSCDNADAQKVTDLPAPSGFAVSEGILTWDAVQNASGYAVKIGDIEYPAKTPKYLLPEMYGTSKIEIKAKGDGVNFNDSEWTTYEFEMPCKALQYIKLADNSGYEISVVPDASSKDLKGRVYIPDTYNGLPVKGIADDAFVLSQSGKKVYNNVTTGIRLPSGLEYIGASAFSGCSALTDIVIPDSVKEIGGSAFKDCTALKSINIPKSLSVIPLLFIQNCPIEQIVLPEGLTEIYDYAFAKSSLKSISIPASVKRIGSNAFYDCAELSEIHFSETLPEEIGINAFGGTKLYTEAGDFVIIDDNILINYKGNEATVNVPENVKYIATGAFSNNISAKTVNIPDGVKFLGGQTFAGSVVESVRLPRDLVAIPSLMFAYCTNLKTIVLPENIVSIGDSAFAESALSTLVIPKTLKTISSFSIPSSTSVFYLGSESEWGDVKITEEVAGNRVNIVAKYFYAETKPTGEGRYWHYVDGVPTVWGE